MGVRYPYQGTTKDGGGRVICSASVAVFLTGTSTPASIYAASAGGVAVNSVTSGADTSSAPGYFIFYVDRGNYTAEQRFDIKISHSGFNPQTYTSISVGIFSQPWVDVKTDFGAKGDGVTDDTAAIQAAVDSLITSGGTVILPPGIYLLSTINYYAGTNDATYILARSNINIIGNGDSSVLKVGDGQNALDRWNVINKTTGILSNAIYRDFKIDGNAANNLLGTLRSNHFIGSNGGGYNIEISGITFKDCPGANPVAFGAGGAGTGNIKVHDNRFLEMGSGIPGNTCTDHTSIYLLGPNNKIYNNYFKSTNHVTGAVFEVHDTDAEVYGNYADGYGVSGWVYAESNDLVYTNIHDNVFENMDDVLSFYAAGTYNIGKIDVTNNVFTMRNNSTTIVFFSIGPETAGQIIDEINITNNKFIGTAFVGNAVPALSFKQVKNLKFDGNTIVDFGSYNVFGQGNLLGDTYSLHRVIITNNILINTYYALVAQNTTKVKYLEISNNKIFNAGAGYGFNLNINADSGKIFGNQIIGLLAGSYDFTLGLSMVNVFLNHIYVGNNLGGIDPVTGYCALQSTIIDTVNNNVKVKSISGTGGFEIIGGVSEIVYNGGMEVGTPPTGWIADSSPEVFERSAVRKHSGSYSLHVVDSTPSLAGAYQWGGFTVGKSYKLSFWYYLVSGVIYSYSDSGLAIKTYNTTGSWQYDERTWVATLDPIDGHEGYERPFIGNHSNSVAAEFYIDDVSIMQLEDGYFNNLKVSGLLTYADNTTALAGGLTAGDFYRTATGVVMVVYTP